MASIWSTGHWTAVIFSIHGNGWEWYIYLHIYQKKLPIHVGKYIQYMDGMGYVILGDHTRFSRFSMYRVP